MTPTRHWTGACFAAAFAAFGASTAAAQPAGYEGFGGIWHENDWSSIEIGPDDMAMITPDSRWVIDPTVCSAAFEHQFATHTRAELVEFFGLDSTDPYAGMIDEDGASMNDAILAAWPDGDGPVQTLWSYCAAETHGGSLYFLDKDGDLTGIRYSEGLAEIVSFSRDVPPPSHNALDSIQRQEVQAALQRLGFYDGAIDGIFGPGTEAGILAFQQSVGAEETGVLTRQQLMDLLYGP